jgi:hypothetical protein
MVVAGETLPCSTFSRASVSDLLAPDSLLDPLPLNPAASHPHGAASAVATAPERLAFVWPS